ncbi:MULTISPECIES: GGDEF domain-containing protein [unclassified Roseateles]|uniref:GGDEF domain-containing protein n=1 Tax=unclassified Roseateles TaxID=2626991 RepID=UPI0006F5318F|nr:MULTISPECIES: GGDEF domain-containing protein [unclassified Roseateles]KQW50732.1 hypothetical protein ASC81_23810 [Pelomonas sp. Root405]KRA70908.1 hypothetical protein ASD88_13805 [Pelomonas sp. Root662]
MNRLTLPGPRLDLPLNLLLREVFYPLLAVLMVGLTLVFAVLGSVKPLVEWHGMDVLAEGGMALMVGVWLVYVRGSRPAGRVTTWLTLGLAGMLVGEWVDALDEVWRLPKAAVWDNWLEALTPLGMVLLTVGLHFWRQEQRVLSRQLAQRERFLRDHRAVDRVTQLADAGYMAEQIQLERSLGRTACVLMLGFDGFDRLTRELGMQAADHALEAASLTLLLNLRPGDLLCRYAGDRFVVLLPDCGAAEGRRLGDELKAALEPLNFNGSDGQRLRLPVRAAHGDTAGSEPPAQLLLGLLRRL